MKQRILVCGGRDYGSVPTLVEDVPYEQYQEFLALARNQRKTLKRILDAAKAKFDIECVIEGGARGADRLGGEWADNNLIYRIQCPADWKTHGKKAGILRNQTMLEEHNPTLVIAFPGGDGTKDMVSRSRKAGIRVIEVNL